MSADKPYIRPSRTSGAIKTGVPVMVPCSWFFGFDIPTSAIFAVLSLIFLSKTQIWNLTLRYPIRSCTNSKRKTSLWGYVYFFLVSFKIVILSIKTIFSQYYFVKKKKKKKQVVQTKIFVSLRSLCTNPLSCKYTSPFNISSNIFVNSSHASTNSRTLLSFSLNMWHVFLR